MDQLQIGAQVVFTVTAITINLFGVEMEVIA